MSTKLGGAILCNATSKGDDNKLDCRGVFTSFLAWAFPTTPRAWHSILTLYEYPTTDTIFINTAISFGHGRKINLTKVELPPQKGNFGLIVDIPQFYSFTEEGLYFIHFSIVGTTNTLSLPVKVITQPWPRVTKKQLNFLEKNSLVPNSVQITIICSKCSHPVLFQDSFLPGTTLAKSAHPFPDSGIYKCEECGDIMYLKDIQGQARSSIIATIPKVWRGGK